MGTEEQLAEFKMVGKIAVESGLCLIGDPCLSLSGSTYKALCNRMFQNETADVQNVEYGITVGTDDGTYPVYVRRGQGGAVVEVRIMFIIA